MADEIDCANDIAQAARERAEKEARVAASNMPAGEPGECDFCGEWSGRLVGGACAPCRDKMGLP